MLSVKLVRSLVLGETINNSSLLLNNHNHNHNHNHAADGVDDDDDGDGDGVDEQQSNSSSSTSSGRRRRRRRSKVNTITTTITKTPLLLFLPTKELVKDTYRLATIARDMGMDLYPNPSLSHIIFTWPSSSTLSASSSLWSSSSSSWPSSTSSNAVPLPFPLLTTASITHLHSFVSLSKGLFKVVFYKSNNNNNNKGEGNNNISNWNCSSLSLFSRVIGDRIDSMDSFSRVLAGMGWTLFKTKKNPSPADSSSCGGPNSVYLFRKVDSNRIQALKPNNGSSSSSSSSSYSSSSSGGGEFRVRELRLPPLDFRNAPMRILQYILLMTDDVFYLA